MNIYFLFSLLAKPFIHNIPRAMTALLFLFFVFSWLVGLVGGKKRIIKIIVLTLIIIIGLFSRFFLAWFFRGNFDLWYWEKAANLVVQGKNIYRASSLYNYFPPWVIILSFLKRLSFLFPSVPFYTIVKLFLTLIDLLTLYILFLLAKVNKKFFLKVAVGFFLNPVLIIITGFHGQFENIAVLFILLGIYLYQKKKYFFLSWLSFTFGGIVKHMFFNQVLFFLNNVFKKNKLKVFFLFSLSSLIAFATLLPYWQEAKDSIVKNLFCSYVIKSYGMSFVINKLRLGFLIGFYKYLFIFLFFATPFLIKKKSLLRSCLLGTLFFVSFTPGISDQYFILPVAIGSLTSSIWFYSYTLFTSLYLFGSSAQFNINFFKIFPNNIIFLVSLCWFFRECLKNEKTHKF